jgi:curli biogenesis system outer membrane secretion channel CsgG
MSNKWGLLAAAGCVALAACQTTSSDPNVSMASAASGGTSASASPPVSCQQPIGSATVVEPDPASAAAFQSVGLTSPVPMLRIMLSESNCFRVIDQAAMGPGGRAPAAQFLITPNLILSNPDAGGFSAGGFLGNVTGQKWLNNVGGSIQVKEAQTALFISDARSGEQLAAVQGRATATDFGVSFSGYGRGLNSAGAYSSTPDGKVVMAAYVDAFNRLVAQMQARQPPPRVASAKKKR